MIQIFSGVLLNAAPVPEMGKNYGIFMLAIDPPIFLGMDIFQSGVSEVIHTIKNSMPADGVTEILIPGERAFRERAMRIQSGVDIDDELMEELQQLA